VAERSDDAHYPVTTKRNEYKPTNNKGTRMANNKKHYTYMLISTEGSTKDLWYIGVRTAADKPEDDIWYMSSSRLVESMLLSGVKFRKDIISTHESRDEANTAEQDLFSELKCVEELDCINLHSFAIPYTQDQTQRKILHFKQCISSWDSYASVNDALHIIKPADAVYRTEEYAMIWRFNEHPDMLKEYFPSTGTRTYFPGREDMLMTLKVSGEKKFYVTDMSQLEGSAIEKANALMQDHFVPGQKMCVLQEIERLTPLLDEDFTLNLLTKHAIDKDHAFMIDRIAKKFSKATSTTKKKPWTPSPALVKAATRRLINRHGE